MSVVYAYSYAVYKRGCPSEIRCVGDGGIVVERSVASKADFVEIREQLVKFIQSDRGSNMTDDVVVINSLTKLS